MPIEEAKPHMTRQLYVGMKTNSSWIDVHAITMIQNTHLTPISCAINPPAIGLTTGPETQGQQKGSEFRMLNAYQLGVPR
jgi:hypothetical protein